MKLVLDFATLPKLQPESVANYRGEQDYVIIFLNP